MNDYELIAAVLANPQRYSKDLYRRFYPDIKKFVFKFGAKDASTAEDITALALVRILSKLHLYGGLSLPINWMYRVTYNVYLRYQEKQKRLEKISYRAEVENESESEDEALDPDERLDLQHKIVAFRTRIEALPITHRQAFILHMLEQMPMKTLALLLGKPISTLKNYVYLASVNLDEE